MKKLLIILFSIFTIQASSQDGLVKWLDTDTVDIFISVFNAPQGMQVEIGDIIFKQIIINDSLKYTCHYEIRSITNSTIDGDLLIICGEGYEMYEYYVNEVIYDDGKRYHMYRRPKPNFLNEYKNLKTKQK